MKLKIESSLSNFVAYKYTKIQFNVFADVTFLTISPGSASPDIICEFESIIKPAERIAKDIIQTKS